LKPVFERVWDLALPYQDQRDDPGHAEVARHYAFTLLETEGGDEDVIIPAITLHDVGYSQLPKERRLQVFDRNLKGEERRIVQREHEEAGVKLAGELLAKLGYDRDMSEEILEIISQHDTRKGFISRNEGLVRDADKLWRFSRRGFDAGDRRSPADRAARIKDLETSIDKPDYFYSERARQIAREELGSRTTERAPSV
jgi:hypothetical protein